MLLTKNFIQNVVGTWGEAGSTWIESLSSLVKHFANQWHLTHLTVSQNLSVNYIILAEQKTKTETRAVVLKLCMPSIEVQREMNALVHYAGNGAVELLASDIAKGALLLRAISPGKTLRVFYPDQEFSAVDIAAQIMLKLHQHPLTDANIPFPTIQEWLKNLNDIYKDIPNESLMKSRHLAQKLLDTQKERVLLHGDLHHDNILLNGREEWLAIDPKGVLGEPAYEIGAYIRNPMPQLLQHPHAGDLISARLKQFSEQLKIDKQRLIDWSYVQAVLSCCWSIQDNDPHAGRWLECAEFIKKLQ